jgi:hypothetical protein
MADRWHQLKTAIEQSDLLSSDRQAFHDLLHHGHENGTAEPQPKYAPSLDSISKRTGLSRRQVAYSIRHLELHGWIKVTGHVGREHRNVYGLAVGESCECTERRHVPDSRSATRSAVVAPLAVQRGSATSQLRTQFPEESTRSERSISPAERETVPPSPRPADLELRHWDGPRERFGDPRPGDFPGGLPLPGEYPGVPREGAEDDGFPF